MLILHRSLHIPVSHGSHDGSQASGSLQNPGAVIMPSTIEDKIFGKPSFDPSFAKSLRHCGEMSRLGAFRRENPSFAFFSAPLFKNVKDASAHRYASPSLFGLAARHEDHAAFPIQILDAHPVKLSFVPHAGIAHQDDDVSEKLKAAFPPIAGSSARQQFLFPSRRYDWCASWPGYPSIRYNLSHCPLVTRDDFSEPLDSSFRDFHRATLSTTALRE